MSMGGGRFSDEEVHLLRRLAAVTNVTNTRITYSSAFRQMCMRRYLAGESPAKIFREAGLDPDLIGYKRIERSVARWKTAALTTLAHAAHKQPRPIARHNDRIIDTALRILIQPES